MKKTTHFMLIIILLGLTNFVHSQNYDIISVENGQIGYKAYCTNDDMDGIIIYGEDNCDNMTWEVWLNGDSIVLQSENIDSIIIDNPRQTCYYDLIYNGCNIQNYGYIAFIETHSDINPFAEPNIWKRSNASVTIDISNTYLDDDNYIWSTGEIGKIIEVTEPGIYSVTITDYCGSATYSVEVRDNVELYRATCDLLTNKNKVTWHTTPEQAEYVSAVKVYRNNVLVATVPYTDGSFTDDIGSDATQWQYHLVAVSVEGDDCPIPSYWKRTIHLDRIQDSQGNLILQWTPYEDEEPDKETVSAYGIYDIVGGEAHHVVDVGYFTNVYTYNPADFSGYGAVAAVFNNSKGLEDLAFSNRTIEMLLVDENLTGKMVVYPNPTNGEFTVEGVKDLTVFNTLGQTIATSHSENGTHRITVSSGIYFIKSDEGMVRKVVVE